MAHIPLRLGGEKFPQYQQGLLYRQTIIFNNTRDAAGMEVESPKRDSLCGDGLATYSPAAAQLSLVFRVLGLEF
jgi:hypothetical protein